MLKIVLDKFYSLKKNREFVKYSENISWLFIEKVFKIISELFIGVWVARYLGPEDFGLLNYTQSFAGLFMVIATLGLNTIIVRELVKNQSKREVLLGTSFILQLLGSVLVLFLLYFSVKFTSNDRSANILIFIIAFSTVFKSFNVIDFYFQSKVLSKFTAYANMTLLFLSSITKVILILNGASVICFAVVLLFESFFLALGFIYFYFKNNISIFNWKFDRLLARSLLKDSWPLILSGIVITIYMKIDQVMIQEMLGSDAVGQYAAAVRLSEAWYFLPTIIISSLFPAIIQARQKNHSLYYSRLQKIYMLMIWLAIVISIPMYLFSDYIIFMLYGNAYKQASSILQIHTWASVFVFVGLASGKWLISENLQIFSAINTTIGSVLNIILNYLLINKFGIEGAAWATIFSYFVASYLCLFFFKKTNINFINITRSLFFLRSKKC